METKHSKEPWVNVDALRTNHSMIQSQGRVIAEVWSLDKNTDTKANAARIVVCVNALAGLSDRDILDVKEYLTGWKGKSFFSLINDMRAAQAQRDQLLNDMRAAQAQRDQLLMERLDAINFIEWLTSYESEFSIQWGSPKRFSDINGRSYTIDEVFKIYQSKKGGNS